MRIKKVITRGVNTDQFIDICRDPDTTLLQILTNLYAGKCLEGCLVLSINRIVRRGDVMIPKYGDLSRINIDVQFEIEGIVYNTNEIINGCVVKNIGSQQNPIITCEADYALLYMKMSPITASLQVDQIISIRCGRTLYNINAQDISVNGVLFVPSGTRNIYEIDTASWNKNLIARIIADAKTELETLKAQNKSSRLEFFQKNMYPFREKTKPPPGTKQFSLLDLTNPLMPYVSLEPSREILEPTATYYAEENIPKNSVKNTRITATMAHCHIIEEYMNQVRTLYELAAIYEKDEVFAKHNNIWKLWENAKLQI